jgi:hypothetical protein
MKLAKLSAGLLGLTALAFSAMPAAAQSAAFRSAPTACSLDECLATAQQEYACCKNSDADGCVAQYAMTKAPAKSCAQIFVGDVAECPGEVLTCELDELRGGSTTAK